MKYFVFAMLFILSAPLANAQDFFMPGNALSSAKDKLKPLNKDLEQGLSNYNQRRYKVIDGRVIALPNEPEKSKEVLSQDNAPSYTENTELTYKPIQSPAPAEQTEPVFVSDSSTTQPVEQAELVPDLNASQALSDTQSTMGYTINPDALKPVTLHEPAFLKPTAPQTEDVPQPPMAEIEAPVTQNFDNTLPTYKNRYTQYLNDLKIFQKTGKLPRNKELDSILQGLSKRREITLFEGEVN